MRNCRPAALMLAWCCAALLGTVYPSVALAGGEQGASASSRLPCLAVLDQKVSFDLRDADVVTIVDLLARESNVNIVISPHVQGRITIRLENVSRWEALRHIVETMHLRMKEDGCVLRIYAAEDIRLDNEIIEARLKQRQKEAKIAETELLERAVAPLITRSVPIRFVDGKKLAENLRHLLTPSLIAASGVSPARARALSLTPVAPEGGQVFQPEQPFVTFNASANSILIRDREKRVDEIVRLIRELDRETRQVLIEAKILETNRSFIRDLGIQWGFLARGVSNRSFPATWGLQGAHTSQSEALDFPLSGAGNWIVNFPYDTTQLSDTGAALGMTFANIANTFALDIQISAAEQNDDVRIISNPRILTSDNQQAVIKSGVEVPFQTVEDDEVKIEFKEAVIQLEVTPHIIEDDMINLDVKVRKDEVDILRTVDRNPFFLKKEARTKILMKNGDTLIIGGLVKDRQGKVDRGVPWLSRVPVLKHLFSHTRKLKEFEEVMVFITPWISPCLVSETERRKNQPRGENR